MDFVIIANAWQAGQDNPTSKHRIARELVGRGHLVLWLEGAGMRRPRLSSAADRTRIWDKLRRARGGVWQPADAQAPGAGGGLWVLAPLLVPLPRYGVVRRLNGWMAARAAAAWARRLGFRSPVLINYVPVLAESLRFWRGRTVYHCVDRWDAFRMYDARVMAAADRRCCRLAEVVIASSHELLARCRLLNANSHLITHGVDHAHFRAAVAVPPPARPADLPRGSVVGFFGLLSEWLDQALVVALARALPGAAVVMIGRADVPVDALRGIANLHLLGPRPFGVLPAYVAHFDVGIIPFLVNDLTRAVNPIKLREMLAAGCPVVATDLPEVARYVTPGGAVETARTHAEFVEGVRRRLAAPLTPEARRHLSQSVAAETWAAKVDRLLAVISAGGSDGGKARTAS